MTPAAAARLARLARLAIWLPVAVYALTVSSDFFAFADRAIRLSTDDGLANVAYALATEGHYGFLSSPVLLDLPRHDGLFSYGPFYFYAAAAIIWLFGYNLTAVRAVHLAVMITLAVIGLKWFGRRAWGAIGVIVAVGLLVAFERGQWPMVRPDSMVSLFAALMVVASGVAIRTSRAWAWAVAGFSAACGALTHLVAWSLIPAMVIIAVVACVATARKEEGGWRRPSGALSGFAATAVGGLLGTLVFYWSFDFRVGDQLTFLRGYQEYTGSMGAPSESSLGFWALTLEHFRLAYWYLPYPLEHVVWATLGAAISATAAFVWGALPRSREHLALVAPPLIVWVSYLLSLGTYNNFHSGYTILNQVMWLWTLGALGAITVDQTAPWPMLHRVARGSAYALALFLGVGVLTFMSQRTDYRALAARTSVSIAEYTSRVLEAIPVGARAWGGVAFGIEHPGRIQLVQFDDGVTMLQAVDPARRELVSPDYVVWSYAENRGSALSGLVGQNGLHQGLAYLLPDVTYRLVSLTSGPPYGVTRVYARVTPSLPVAPPSATLFDARYGRWLRSTDPSTELVLTPAPGVELVVGYDGGGALHDAVQTLQGALEEGVYLLRIDLTPGLPPDFRAVWMASAPGRVEDTFGEFGPDFDMVSRLQGEDSLYLLHHHAGGPISISQFGSTPGAIVGVSAGRMLALPDYAASRREAPEEHPVLAGDWIHPNTLVGPDWPDQPGIRLSSLPEGEILVEGNDIQFGYQAYGPQIPVEPFQRMRIRFSVRILSGTACLGVLDGTGMAWLVLPDRLQTTYEFQVNDSRTVKPVLANCSPSPDGIVPIRAIIGPGSYAVWSEREPPYVEELMRLYREGRAAGRGAPAGPPRR